MAVFSENIATTLSSLPVFTPHHHPGYHSGLVLRYFDKPLILFYLFQ